MSPNNSYFLFYWQSDKGEATMPDIYQKVTKLTNSSVTSEDVQM